MKAPRYNNPGNQVRHGPSQPGRITVFMPCRDEFEDVWKGGVCPAILSQGLEPNRVDLIKRSSLIFNDIVDSIKESICVIVDISGLNPNVMWEFGFAYGQRKRLIIISQDQPNDFPVDIKLFRAIFYHNTWGGIERLRDELVGFLSETVSHDRVAIAA